MVDTDIEHCKESVLNHSFELDAGIRPKDVTLPHPCTDQSDLRQESPLFLEGTLVTCKCWMQVSASDRLKEHNWKIGKSSKLMKD